MEYYKQIFFEAIIVGIFTALVGFPISTGMMFVSDKDFTWGKYKF